MPSLPKILAIVPARGGSSEIKNKNIKDVAGKASNTLDD